MVSEKDIEDTAKLFKKLHNITSEQDKMQLSIIPINESVALSRNMINDANALILEALKWSGDIRPQVRYGYTREKVLSIINDWNDMVHDFNISHALNYPRLFCREVPDFEDEKFIEKVVRENLEEIFKHQDKLNKLKEVV